MCCVSVLYVSLTPFHVPFLVLWLFHIFCLLCLCAYLFHSFLPSVNLHEAEKEERGGIREY